MLVLLITFMVTAPISTAEEGKSSPESSSILKNEKNDPVTISINSKVKFLFKKKHQKT